MDVLGRFTVTAKLWSQLDVWQPREHRGELHRGGVGGVDTGQVHTPQADVPGGLDGHVLQRLQHLLPDGALDWARLEHDGRVRRMRLQVEGRREGWPA